MLSVQFTFEALHDKPDREGQVSMSDSRFPFFTVRPLSLSAKSRSTCPVRGPHCPHEAVHALAVLMSPCLCAVSGHIESYVQSLRTGKTMGSNGRKE